MLELGRQRGAQEVIAGASAKEISQRFCNHETPLRDSTAWLRLPSHANLSLPASRDIWR
jgi:hypothetical protein